MRHLHKREVERVSRHLAAYCQHTLTRLGYFYENRSDRRVWQVRFHVKHARIEQLTSGDPAIELPIDVHRLPRRITARHLSGEGVLHEISTALGGLPVEARNTFGLSYLIGLEPARPKLPAKDRLPKRTSLMLNEQPAGKYMLPLGVGHNGDEWRPLDKLGHTLIAGVSGSGKSTWIQSALAGLLSGSTPDELKVALIDPKQVEFSFWQNAPHLMSGVAYDEDAATDLLGNLVTEMDNRASRLARVHKRNLAGYNQVADNPLPAILLVIDEAIDLATIAGSKSKFITNLTRLASKARATGIYLWLAAQHPRFDVLPRVVTTNLSTRLAFRLLDASASEMVGVPGSHRIPRTRPGRFLVRWDSDPESYQAYYASDEQLLDIAHSLSPTGGNRSPVLTDDERRVAEIALSELAGAFKIDGIYAQTGPKSQGGVSKHWLEKTARQWEKRGWLASDPSNPTQPRKVTDTLKDLLNTV